MKIKFIISKSRAASFGALLFIFLLNPQKNVFAQWQQLQTFDSFTTCIYSIDQDSIIFVGTRKDLWRSSDFGRTWIQLSLPWVSSIQFKDGLHGWLTQCISKVKNNNFVGTPNCVLRTSDGGLTWNSIYPDSAYPTSILYQPTSQKLFLIQFKQFPSAVSIDDGNTWQNIAPYNLNRCGMTFSNDHHGIITMCNNDTVINAMSVINDTVLITDDDGRTWTKAVMGEETWQPVSIPGTDTVVAFGEIPFGGNWPWVLNRSTDGGYTWSQPKVQPVFGNTGDNHWIDCASIIMTQSSIGWFSKGPAIGMVYSTDLGDSWISIGGPTHGTFDTRFFYSGQYIYAGDSNSKPTTVWRYQVHHYPTITYPGSLQTCMPFDTSFHISFTNTCFGIPTSLDSFAFSGSSNFQLQPLSTPFTLANEQDIGLHYAPQSGSHDTAWLHLYFNQHGDRKDTILTFIGSGPQPDHVSLHLAPSATHVQPGKNFSLDIYPDASASDAGLDTISFTIHYWNDLLNLLNPSAPITVQNGEATVPITIIGNNLSLDPKIPIATLNFEAMLTDTIRTTLALTSPIANPSDKSYTECVLSLSADSTPFNLDLICGDTTIITAMEHTPPFSIKSVQPNPAGNEITIRVAGGVPATLLQLELFDALGRGQDVRSTSLQSGVVLDVSGVPSGVYFIRLSANGYVQSRSVVIQK